MIKAYCIANTEDTTTTTAIVSTTIRSSFRYFHRRPSSLRPNRNRHRLATRQNYSSLANLDYLRQVTIIEENISSKSTKNCYRLFYSYQFFILININLNNVCSFFSSFV